MVYTRIVYTVCIPIILYILLVSPTYKKSWKFFAFFNEYNSISRSVILTNDS